MNIFKKNNLFLLFVIVLGLMLRLYKINIPLLEFYPSRQIQTADIARNFFKTDLNILHPAVSYFGARNTSFLIEFPGYNYLVSLLYFVFEVHEVIGRLISVLAWLVSIIFIYKIVLKLGTKTIANISCLFYSLSPLSILISRSFQPDQLMIAFSLAGIYYFLKWNKENDIVSLLLSVGFVSISVLLKLPSVIFTFLPIFLFILINKRNRVKPLLIYITCIIVPTFLWYGYAYIQRQSSAITVGGFSLSTWFGFDVFLNPNYYLYIFGFEYNLVLLPIGIILFVIGIFQKLKPSQRFLYFWLGGVFVYFLVFNKHNMTHEYYHLPILPIAVLFVGIAGEKVWTAIYTKFVSKGILIFILVFTICLLMIIPTLQRAYKPIDRFSYVITTAAKIKSVTKPSDPIIGSMDSGPSLVYYSNRNGWQFAVNREDTETKFNFYGVKNLKTIDSIDELNNLRQQGAVIFASANKSQFVASGAFANYMYSNYPVIEDDGNSIIFSLINVK